MGLLQLKLSMFLLISSVGVKISAQTPTCGNNTFFILYPFKLLQEAQNPHHITPYDLKCNSQGVVVLSLPFSGEFFVRDIDYFQQKIQLYDPSNCLPRRLRNLSLSSSPFVAVSYQKYTFFSCPLESPSSQNLTTIRCLSNSTASVVAAPETSTMDGIKNSTACKVMYSLQVPISQVFEYAYNGIDGDLQLAWIDPSSKRDSRGKTSSKPGALTIILICVVTISTALLVSLFCLGCGLSVIVVMLDIEEANYERSWSCRSTRMWEMARIRFRGPRGAEPPLDELSFMSSSSQRGQPSALQPTLNEPSSTSPLPSAAGAHPFGYFLSFRPSPPQVSTRAPAPPDELQSTANVVADTLDGSVSIMPSPEVSSMPAADDGEVFIDAAPPDEDISPTRIPTPLDELPSTPSSPSVAGDGGLDGFVSVIPSPELRSVRAALDDGFFLDAYSVISPTQVPRAAAALPDESSSPPPPPPPPPFLPTSPSVAGDDGLDGFISVIPSPELRSVRAALDDGFFLDAYAVISPTQVPRGPASPLDESSSTLRPPPPPPPPPFLPPSVAEGHPFDYFLSVLSVHFGRTNAASLDELSSTPSSPSVGDDFSVVHSPQVPAMAGDAHHDEFSSHEELPTEDVIIGGSECISGPNGDSCTICLEKYKASERLRLIRKCNHCFHSDCLEQWLQRKNTCPICRTNVI